MLRKGTGRKVEPIHILVTPPPVGTKLRTSPPSNEKEIQKLFSHAFNSFLNYHLFVLLYYYCLPKSIQRENLVRSFQI